MAGKFDAQNAQNLGEIEKQFAVKAVEHAQTHWNLLALVPPRTLKLTALDDEIYQHVQEAFPEVKSESWGKLDEDWMKTEDGKKRWRDFCMKYENKIKDYNFGSLIRTDSTGEYGERNTIFVTRIQFYAIEIARNRLGLNDAAAEISKVERADELKKKEAKKKEREARKLKEQKEKEKNASEAS